MRKLPGTQQLLEYPEWQLHFESQVVIGAFLNRHCLHDIQKMITHFVDEISRQAFIHADALLKSEKKDAT